MRKRFITLLLSLMLICSVVQGQKGSASQVRSGTAFPATADQWTMFVLTTGSSGLYVCSHAPTCTIVGHWVAASIYAGAGAMSGLTTGGQMFATSASTAISLLGSYPASVLGACGGSCPDAASKIAYTITNFCPVAGGSDPNTIGCTIDARDFSGSDLIMKSNMFHGTNRQVNVILGAHIYIACVPQVAGQSGYRVVGVGAPASIAGDTIIRAGDSTVCGGTAFPGGATGLVFAWQHGPFAAGTYYPLFADCGTSATDIPFARADCFGSALEHLQLDCNDLADFCFYSSAGEERSVLHDVSIIKENQACGFWDRGFQVGPPNGGSGPVHYGVFDVTCTNDTAGRYGFVGWGGVSFLEITGNGTGAQGYVKFSANNPLPAAIITHGGSGYTTASCVLHAYTNVTPFIPDVSASCGVTLSGGAVASIALGAGDTKYPSAAVPGGGPIFDKLTLTAGTGSTKWVCAICLTGYYDYVVRGVHTENVLTDTVLIGDGNAPYGGGLVESIDITTGAAGNGVHFGVGATDLGYAAIAIHRELSVGAVITDDNTGCVLSTNDTPISHATVAFYAADAGCDSIPINLNEWTSQPVEGGAIGFGTATHTMGQAQYLNAPGAFTKIGVNVVTPDATNTYQFGAYIGSAAGTLTLACSTTARTLTPAGYQVGTISGGALYNGSTCYLPAGRVYLAFAAVTTSTATLSEGYGVDVLLTQQQLSTSLLPATLTAPADSASVNQMNHVSGGNKAVILDLLP